MKKLKVLSVLSVLAITSCSAFSSSSKDVDMTNTSGFLSDYSLLSPVASSNDNIKIYRYVNPEFQRSDYKAVIVNPVSIYQPKTDEQGKTVLNNVQDSLNTSLSQMVSDKFPVTQTPGAGVAVVDVALTGAEVNGEGFKVRNLIPVSAVIKLATKATDTDKKQAVLLIEAKITDSVTKKLIGQSVTSISSEEFRDSNNTEAEFEASAQVWMKQAVQNASGYAK
ncbi:MAG: DUF3313 domain-containing protein [Burkholderiales bacterium]|nr:DUF3313 domain-containing protein [Burkholderiales bacterium]